LNNRKVEIMYFYSDMYENEKNLSEITRKISQQRKDIQIRLVNIDDPRNEELAELYGVNMVPLLIFLTPEGEIAAKRFLPLSAEDIVHEIAEKISKGQLPSPHVEEIKTKIQEAFKSVTRRNELTDLVVEQIESDLVETSMEQEVEELISSHISAINHTVSDLLEIKKILQKFSKKSANFVV